MKTSQNPMLKALKERRSFFPPQFQQGAQIPDQDLEAVLDCANWAPNHGQTEPWRFKVYTQNALENLGETLAKLYQEHEGEKAKKAKTIKLKGLPTQASHVIAIIGHFNTNPKIPKWEEIAAVAMAVQNIYLAAQALGYGGYWSSPKFIESQGMADFLGLAENEACLGFFYLGVPNPDLPLPERTRKTTAAEKTTWVRD